MQPNIKGEIHSKFNSLLKKQWVRVSGIIIGLFLAAIFGKWGEYNAKIEVKKCTQELDKLRSEILLLTTKQLKTEREIEKIQERTLLVATAIDDNTAPEWVKDRQGYVVWINEAYEQFFNVKFELIVGTKGENYFNEKEIKAFLKNDSIVMATKEAQTFVESTSNGIAGWKTSITTKSPVVNHGFVMGTRGRVEVRYSKEGNEVNPYHKNL